MHFGGSPFDSFFGGGMGQERTKPSVNTTEYYETLGIAKNASESYNAERFSRDAEVKHFTEDV